MYGGILYRYRPHRRPLLVQSIEKKENFPKISLIFRFDGWHLRRCAAPIFAFLPSRSVPSSMRQVFEPLHERFAVFLQRLFALSSSRPFLPELLIALAHLWIIWLLDRAIPTLFSVWQYFLHFPSPIFLYLISVVQLLFRRPHAFILSLPIQPRVFFSTGPILLSIFSDAILSPFANRAKNVVSFRFPPLFASPLVPIRIFPS
jgi:hypothetical protein